jgi:histone-lysine N-methyltransferase SETMAR
MGPHLLSNANKATRVAMAGILLRLAKNTGFYDEILTCDEKWIQYDNSTRKRQRLEPGVEPIPTPKPDFLDKKVMPTVWWNSQGIGYFELLKPGQTITGETYAQQLERVNNVLLQKGLDPSNIKFIQDNARPHVAKIVQEKLEELGWETLPHPPYSPDISPSDYHLFRSMRSHLAGNKFKEVQEVEKWIADFFASKQANFYAEGIHSLHGRWKQIMLTNGEYIVD